MELSFNYHVDDIDLEVTYIFSRGTRGAREASTGIPLEPDEPASVEVIRADVAGHNILELMGSNHIEQLEEAAEDDLYTRHN